MTNQPTPFEQYHAAASSTDPFDADANIAAFGRFIGDYTARFRTMEHDNACAVSSDDRAGAPSHASRTLTVGEIVDRLARLDRCLPVVLDAEDEPLGCYGVRDVSVEVMQREATYAAEPCGRDVYHGHTELFESPSSERYDEPGPVAFLSLEAPRSPSPGAVESGHPD